MTLSNRHKTPYYFHRQLFPINNPAIFRLLWQQRQLVFIVSVFE